MYSAIKIKGKKLYEYARKNETVEIPSREIEIYKMELSQIKLEEKQIIFHVKCSKGTYIRSLCEDIAEKLETVGYMKELNRTMVGNFRIEDSVTIEELEQNKNDQEYIQKNVITIEDFFANKNKDINLDKKKLNLFLNGVQLTYCLKDGLYRIYSGSTFIGIGLVKNTLLKREIIVEN